MNVVSLSMPRVIVSSTGSGVGKSLISLGLAYELRRRRQSVSCAVLGPRLAQATILKRVAGRSARCLDPRLLSSSQILASMFQAGVGADFIIIEGQSGVFDGTEVGSFAGSDAEMAALTKTPVVLVVDARGLGASVAALVKGFSVLAQGARVEGGFDIAGAILNRASVGSSAGTSVARDAAYYGKALEAFGMPAPLGVLPEFFHESRFPGDTITQQKNETLLPRQFLVELHRLVQQHVDIDRLVEQAEMAPAVPIPDFSYDPMHRRCRIAVSDDSRHWWSRTRSTSGSTVGCSGTRAKIGSRDNRLKMRRVWRPRKAFSPYGIARSTITRSMVSVSASTSSGSMTRSRIV